MTHSWFRFYNGSLDDPKVQLLPAHLFKFWVNCLCLASKHSGKLPSIGNIAFSMRIGSDVARECQDALIAAGLLDIVDDVASPHNWNGRQYVSDVSTERVKRFRKRQRNATETVPDTDSDTEQTQIQKVVASAVAAASTKGTRWESDRVVPKEWIEAAHASRSKHLHPLADLDTEAEKFANFWASKSGKDGAKLDWKRTWINWALTAKGVDTNGSGKRSTAHEDFAKGAILAAEEFDRKRGN